MQDEAKTPFTESWFASGQRLGYDPRTRTIDLASPLKVWIRVDGDPTVLEHLLNKRGLATQALAHLIGDFVASVEPRATPPRDRQGATTHS